MKLICGNDSQIYMKAFRNNSIKLPVLAINDILGTIEFSLYNLFNGCYSQETISYNYLAYLPTLKPTPNAYYKNIRIFYGCTSRCESIRRSQSFYCSNSDGSDGTTAYYFGDPFNISRSSTNSSCSCTNHVTFLVDKRVVDELGRSNTDASFVSLIYKWSSINMSYMNHLPDGGCSDCENSGGSCGSHPSSDLFVCYCRDGPQPLSCTPKSAYHHSGGRKDMLYKSGAVASLIGIMILTLCANKRKRIGKLSFLWSSLHQIEDQNVAAFLQSYGSLAPKRYTYADIKKMTSSFKDKLGEGGYGSVYKGRLPNGRFVAVKKLKDLKGGGKDFINEVLSISRTNHVNVVTLLGFCFEGNKRALIFEFLPNGSLEKFIHGTEIRQSLQWETMFNIAIGIARGLDYLHRGCNTRILHFDIKPHNILLDDEFHPKISDFGLARLCPEKNSMISMSEARGTIGYIAPEIFCRNYGGVSHKSDVYSYGMMLIDLVCGRKIPTNEVQRDNSEMYFPEWIYNRLEPVQEAAVDGIEDNNKNELERKMILVSLWCIQMHPSDRPPINRVVEMLEGPFESLPMPPKPHASSPARPVFDASLMSTT